MKILRAKNVSGQTPNFGTLRLKLGYLFPRCSFNSFLFLYSGRKKRVVTISSSDEDEEVEAKKLQLKGPAPAQENLEKIITASEQELNSLVTARDLGLAPDDVQKRIDLLRKNLKMKKKALDRKKKLMASARKARARKKAAAAAVVAQNPHLKTAFLVSKTFCIIFWRENILIGNWLSLFIYLFCETGKRQGRSPTP